MLESILEPLSRAGIRVSAVYPETLAVPCTGEAWSALEDGDRVIIRTAQYAGFGAESTLVTELLSSLDRSTTRLRWYGERLAPSTAHLDALLPADCQREAPQLSAWAVLAQHAPTAAPLNLLPDRYRSRQEVQAPARYLKLAGALFVIAAGLFYGPAAWQIRALEHRTSEVRAEELALFSATFPKVKRVVNVRVQANNELRRLRDQDRVPTRFLDLFQELGAAFEVHRGSLALVSLAFSDGGLGVTLDGGSVRDIEALNTALRDGALEARILSAETGEHAVRGRVHVSRP